MKKIKNRKKGKRGAEKKASEDALVTKNNQKG